MSATDLANEAQAASAARIRKFDDEALLAAKAFAYGQGEFYLQAVSRDIQRQIAAMFDVPLPTVELPEIFTDPATIVPEIVA